MNFFIRTKLKSKLRTSNHVIVASVLAMALTACKVPTSESDTQSLGNLGRDQDIHHGCSLDNSPPRWQGAVDGGKQVNDTAFHALLKRVPDSMLQLLEETVSNVVVEQNIDVACRDALVAIGQVSVADAANLSGFTSCPSADGSTLFVIDEFELASRSVTRSLGHALIQYEAKSFSDSEERLLSNWLVTLGQTFVDEHLASGAVLSQEMRGLIGASSATTLDEKVGSHLALGMQVFADAFDSRFHCNELTTLEDSKLYPRTLALFEEYFVKEALSSNSAGEASFSLGWLWGRGRTGLFRFDDYLGHRMRGYSRSQANAAVGYLGSGGLFRTVGPTYSTNSGQRYYGSGSVSAGRGYRYYR